jgi:hypothetical protein
LASAAAFDIAKPTAPRLADGDALLQLRLLQLHADLLLQRVDVSHRIEPEHDDRAVVRPAQSLDTFHRRCLAGTVGTDQAEDFSRLHVERHAVNGDRAPVGFAERYNVNRCRV